MAEYRHDPLPTNRSIRVLLLKPGNGPNASLQCELVPVSLDESPKFCALSYSWDAEAPSYPILCWSKNVAGVLKITPNCAAALYKLRHDREEVTLWIDGICIDQSSLEERSQQVALMIDIYRCAERVVVWLGEGDASSDTAIDLIKRIGDVDRIIPPEERLSFDEHTRESQLQLRTRIHNNARALTADVKSDADDKLGPLFRRSWFQRMWTVQETALPLPPRIDVRCGDSTLSWYVLWMALDFLRAIGYKFGPLKNMMRLQHYVGQMMVRYHAPFAEQLIQRFPGLKLDLTIVVMLLFCRPRRATDPKDKAYALYGLLQALNVELPKPDYRKSLSAIYAELTTVAIKHDKSLRVLFHVSSDHRRSGLPSWVPDWSDTDWDEGEPRYPIAKQHFKATKDAETSWRFTNNPLELVVYGKIVDAVIYRVDSFNMSITGMSSEPWPKGPDGRLIMTEAMHELYKIHSLLKERVDVAFWSDTYPSGDTVEDALARILVGDWPHVTSGEEMKLFPAWLKAMRASDEELASAGASALTDAALESSETIGLRSLVRSFLGLGQESDPRAATARQNIERNVPHELRILTAMTAKEVNNYNVAAMAHSTKRCFFRTENGYVGTAPDQFPGAMQAGDHIALIGGLAMPFILREVDGGYRLISHCIVHGFMYGEVWDHVQQDLDEIVLV
ncbi:Heterokaryon incompatibility protein [Paramyrothecium foliicola]|nr:Heterokaryon incompatibility protein [Paramyrothecium foliicola]